MITRVPVLPKIMADTPTMSFSFGGLQNIRMVYAVKRKGEYIYIGSTTRFLFRLPGHHIFPRLTKLEDDDIIDVWTFKTDKEMRDFEFEMIQTHAPRFNITHHPGARA